MIHKDPTEMLLFVRTSREDIVSWDRRRIVEALIRETNVDIETADQISREVEKQIFSSGIKLLTASLIRELVDVKLIERGMEKATRMHARLGFPLYDIDQLLIYPNKENANIPHGPEGTNLTLAEGIKKEYALLNVFAEDVGYAHINGDIHLHNLGYIDRLYSSSHSLEYIKKFGLKLAHSLNIASPARHPEVLLAHMIRFAAALQGNFAGAISWDAVNVYFAPYLTGVSTKEIKQLAQMLIYEFSQQAVGRGGQTIFTDIHLYWHIPPYLENVPAIGPGGSYTGQTYSAYLKEAQRLAWAIFEVFYEGDAAGRPFVFPRPFVHITEAFFQTPESRNFLLHVCKVAAEKGNPHFVLDRGNFIKIAESHCLTLNNQPEKSREPLEARGMRHFAIHNVSINLPRLGYKAAGDDQHLRSLLTESLDLAARAHVQKKHFIEKLLSYGDEGPLALLTMNHDGKAYVAINSAIYLIGLVGLNELVHIHVGKQLHDSGAAREFGLKLVSFIQEKIKKLSRQYEIRLVLEQTPAESTAYRFARLDLKHFSPQSGHFVRGNIARGELFYTNSTFCNAASQISPFERVRLEGEFHPAIEGKAATYIWLGEARPSEESIADFIEQAFKKTANQQITFCPEFTTCINCYETSRGLLDCCPFCASSNVEGITMITGYFSNISKWNKGKLAELKERRRSGDFFSKA